MSKNFRIAVREIELKDVPHITSYWMDSDPSFLVSMGVDLDKLPTKQDLKTALTEQINTSITEKKSYAVIWELNGKQIGHSNVNRIVFGEHATMHLHLWEVSHRKKGMGTEFVKKSLPFYFDRLEIKKLICEPYALNPSPNKTLEKIGFEFIKAYRTTPGASNFEQQVNRWELTREKFNEIT